MKAKDIKLTVKNADACDAIDRGLSNLLSYFNVGEEIDQEVDTISDGLHVLKRQYGNNARVQKAYSEMINALHTAHSKIEKMNDEWQRFYEDIPG